MGAPTTRYKNNWLILFSEIKRREMMEYFRLRNGMEISCVGMGTYPISALRLMCTIPKLHGGV